MKKFKFAEKSSATENIYHTNYSSWLEDAAKIGAWSYNVFTKAIWWSEGVYKIYEMEPNAPIENQEKHFDKKELLILETAMLAAISDLKPWNITLKFKTAKGNTRHMRSIGRPEKKGKEIIILGTCMDVTEHVKNQLALKENEEMMYRSSKLAQLGEMAALLNHEINNPLMIISGATQGLGREIKIESQRAERYLKMINKGVEAIKKQLHSIKHFAHFDFQNTELVDLNETVSECVEMVEDLYGKIDVKVSFNSKEDDVFILGNEDNLKQVFLNLLNNARDAIEDNDDKVINVSMEIIKDQVLIHFEDSGSGVSENIQGKIFDSFFTTKKQGKGTGIGLNLCRRISQAFGGNIKYSQSEMGGARFTLSFPLPLENKKVA